MKKPNSIDCTREIPPKSETFSDRLEIPYYGGFIVEMTEAGKIRIPSYNKRRSL